MCHVYVYGHAYTRRYSIVLVMMKFLLLLLFGWQGLETDAALSKRIFLYMVKLTQLFKGEHGER